MKHEKLVALAKKLKALSDQGEGGEKETARTMLIRHCERYGISLDDLIEQEDAKRIWIKYGRIYKGKNFICQIIRNVLNWDHPIGTHSDFPNEVTVICTLGDELEIRAKYDFYKRKLKHEIEITYHAFIQTNHLYSNKPTNPNGQPTKKGREIFDRMETMKKHEFRKQLENKS